MTSYTGTVRTIPLQGIGRCFPLFNPFNHFRIPRGTYHLFRNRRVYTAMLTGTAAAIATDDYTFTLFVADRTLVVDACFIVDPIGIEPDTTNDNNFTLNNYTDTVTLCQQSTGYGVVANEPWEITRANTVANRTITKGEVVTLVVDGDNSGQVINHGTVVFVVCHYG